MARQGIGKAEWSVARAIWEGEPLATYQEIAEKLNVSRQAVQHHAKRFGWIKRLDQRAVSELAHAAADSKLTQTPVDGSTAEGWVDARGLENRLHRVLPDLPLGASPEALAKAAQASAVDQRADLLGTHRKELLGARNLIYAAIKSSDIDVAKKAKVVAEAMKIVQDGERKAWGLDTDDKGKPSVQVIINRKSGMPIGR
jgi:hypothetical protein